MRLVSELTVDAPLARTWPALLELGGRVRAQLGAEYAGIARLDDVDEDEHVAGFHAHGRDADNGGLASATIAARLSEDADRTRIAVATDLRMTGGEAKPDQAAVQRAVDELLGQLAASLARTVADAAPKQGSDPWGAATRTRSESGGLNGSDPTPPSPRQLDAWVGVGKVAERALLVTAGVAVGLVVGRLLWGRR